MFADPGKATAAGGSLLPESINPNNFPAKLWRLVNNPLNRAIRWDAQGHVLVIDQHLFEELVLSPRSSSGGSSDSADAFKTTNFSSFVRQLNLYGFKKADAAAKDSGGGGGVGSEDCVQYHYFYNPNFKRNRPELVASLRRLTVHNKAKIQAGLDVKNRGPSRFLRYSGGFEGRDKGSYSLQSPAAHQESTHPYLAHKAPATTAHNGTPAPPRFLMRGHGAALSPTTFATDKGIPVSFNQHYTAGVASGSNAMHIQPGLLACSNRGNPNFTFNAQYQSGYYSPLCQCYHPNLVGSQMAGSGLQTGSFSSHSYYQASYPIADEVMQTPPNSSLVRVVTPENPRPVLVPFSATTVLCDNPASTVEANHLYPGPIVVSLTSEAGLVTFQQQEESVISQPELVDDAKCKVEDTKATEVLGVEVSVAVRDSSQADSSSCTGSAPHL